MWGWMSDSQSAYSSYHLEGKVIFEGVGSVTAWVAEGGRMVLCYVQGSGRRKRKKGVGCGSERQENYRSGRRDCASTRLKWCPIPIQPRTGSYQLVLSLRAFVERASDP
ncbi:hypothetical protein Tco_1340988, partial [Tanacetum coccineum]